MNQHLISPIFLSTFAAVTLCAPLSYGQNASSNRPVLSAAAQTIAQAIALEVTSNKLCKLV